MLEHITTRDAVQFVEVTGPNVAATITAHHLLMNRNALFLGGIRPHHYCLPVLKREEHREALVEAATSGNPKFFLGTDSAPHARSAKEAACGCAGIYTAHAAIELYAIAFEEAGALDKLEGFASHVRRATSTACRATQDTDHAACARTGTCRRRCRFGADELVPLRAGETIPWKLGLAHPVFDAVRPLRSAGRRSPRAAQRACRRSGPANGKRQAGPLRPPGAYRPVLRGPASSRPVRSRPGRTTSTTCSTPLPGSRFRRPRRASTRMHAAEIPREGGRRGRLRDMLTIFDEGGAIVSAG